jgi:hypothetical protein
MTTLDDLRKALGPGGDEWVGSGDIAKLFPAAGRRWGRDPLPTAPGWTADEAARALLLDDVPVDDIEAAYRYGDASEKAAVLKALPLLPIGDAGVPLLHDALRTNDTRLVAAALGPYAEHLDDSAWRQGVLKCVFMGVPLAGVHGLNERADDELASMLAAFAQERTAAGREVPADALALLVHPPSPGSSGGAASEAQET